MVNTMAKNVTDNLRASFTRELAEFLAQKYDTDVCQTAAGTLMIPVVDEAGEDRWLKFSVIVPKDANEEDGTDGYSLAADYTAKLDAAAERKAKAAEKAAAAKAKRDAKIAKN